MKFARFVAPVLLMAVVLGGLGWWLITTAKPNNDDGRRDIGSALLSGAVLSTVFVVAEKQIEQTVTERQTREQYQLALGTADTLAGKTLAGLNLSGLILASKDLTGANLTRTNMSRADLRVTKLAAANLPSSDLTQANLTEADLTNANLIGAILNGARLELSDLTGANLREADLRGARFQGANLTNANMMSANMGEPFADEVYSLRSAFYAVALVVKAILYSAHILFSGLLFGQFPAPRTINAAPKLDGAKWDPLLPPVWPADFDPPENEWKLARE